MMCVQGNQRRAMVIGISSYKQSRDPDPPLPNLPGAEQDAVNIYNLLCQRGYSVSPCIGDITYEKVEEELHNFYYNGSSAK